MCIRDRDDHAGKNQVHRRNFGRAAVIAVIIIAVIAAIATTVVPAAVIVVIAHVAGPYGSRRHRRGHSQHPRAAQRRGEKPPPFPHPDHFRFLSSRLSAAISSLNASAAIFL